MKIEGNSQKTIELYDKINQTKNTQNSKAHSVYTF